MSGSYIMPGDLPESLCAMIRDADKTVRAWIEGGNGHFEIGDVDWDHAAALPEPSGHGERVDADNAEHALAASHAIGFICGVAAALDVTPLTLLESYDRKPITRGLTTAELMAAQGFKSTPSTPCGVCGKEILKGDDGWEHANAAPLPGLTDAQASGHQATPIKYGRNRKSKPTSERRRKIPRIKP